MRKVKAWWKGRTMWMKAVLIVAAVIVGAPLLLIGYLRFGFPDARDADPGLEVDRTPPAISRGEYLFHHVADCTGCHTRRDFTKFGGPQIADVGGGWGDVRSGGQHMPLKELPGKVYPSNITMDRATGLGAWNDDEIIRAIREGVSRDGSPLFPLMPYTDYAQMSDTDVQAIVAYMRHVPSVARAVPQSEIDFPVGLLVRMAPQPVTAPVPDVNRSDRVKYGEYLATMAACIECHTDRIDGERQTAMLLAGGRSFTSDTWRVVTANITPDPETGLNMSEQEFVDLFQSFKGMAEGSVEIPDARERNTVMPWLAFSGINDSDLRAIYAYLKSVRPVKNRVDTGFRRASTAAP